MMKRLVYGVGDNDADYPVCVSERAGGKEKILWFCHFYSIWTCMLARCYSGRYQAKYPTYAGCTVSKEWHSFMAFRSWVSTKCWDGKNLDKDILKPGNKIYSPETCVFVSTALNNFLLDNAGVRGKWPVGVCWSKKNGRFDARCRNPFTGRREHLGYFNCPDMAHEAWRNRKHELALQYAEIQDDPRIADALRKRYAPV